MATRPGTGKVVKFFRESSDTLKGVMSEVEQLTDKDLAELVEGIENGTLTY